MYAAIDVGSNTVRMLLGNVRNGKVIPFAYSREITRLKGGQTEAGLAPESMQRTLTALQRFHTEILAHEIKALVVVGTEALRTATNAKQFIDKVHHQAGMSLTIFSGEQEARCSARGALSVVDPIPESSIIVDIGGGSTEIVITRGTDVLFSQSYPLGVVRLAEMKGRGATDFIGEILTEIGIMFTERGLLDTACLPTTDFIGTAGTVTTLAAIDLGMVEYDWRRVNNHRLSALAIDGIYDRLVPMTVAERERLPGMEAGRGDLIIPGLQVLKGLLELFSKNELIVSDFGLLEGLLLQMAAEAAIH